MSGGFWPLPACSPFLALARELRARGSSSPPVPGQDYALTEVVQGGSPSELGVWSGAPYLCHPVPPAGPGCFAGPGRGGGRFGRQIRHQAVPRPAGPRPPNRPSGGGGEVVVVSVSLDQHVRRVEPVRGEEVGLVGNLAPGDAANEMSPNVVRFRWRRVVGVTADVEIAVVGEQFIVRNDRRVARDVGERVVRGYDLLDMLRQQVVLCTPSRELGVRVD